jgi:hypothetical protein
LNILRKPKRKPDIVAGATFAGVLESVFTLKTSDQVFRRVATTIEIVGEGCYIAAT